MPDNLGTWEIAVEMAMKLYADEGEAAFRVELGRLGFTTEEIDGFVALEQQCAIQTDPKWAAQMRREARR